VCEQMTHPNDRRPADAQPPKPHQPSQQRSDAWGDQEGHSHERQQLAHEAARHTKARRATVLDKIEQIIIYLVIALEVLLSLRFLLRLTAANPDNTFAGAIYAMSRPFVNPFSTLFISPTFDGSRHIFDVNILVAMTAYLALLALVLGLLRVLFEDS